MLLCERLVMKKKTIAIDIDGTIRNFDKQLDKYLEMDHPDKIDKYREVRDKEFWSLTTAFDGDTDSLFKWVYDERVFELFGMAGRTHPRIIDDLNILNNVLQESQYELVIASVQRDRSIPATLHWLSKWGSRVKRIEFYDSMQEKIDARYDIYLDDCPMVIEQSKQSIKVPYGFNEHLDVPTLDVVNGKFDDLYDILGVHKILKL